MEEDYKTRVGKRIKKFRKDKGLKQKELANMINIPASTLANYESGRREPNLEALGKIARALKTQVSNLLGGKKVDGYYKFSEQILSLTYDIFEEIYNGSHIRKLAGCTAKDFMNSDKYFIKELRDVFQSIARIKIENINKRIFNEDNTPLVRGGYTHGVSYEKGKSFELGNKLNDKEYLEYMINKYQQYLDNLEKGLDNHNLPEENQ